ncbi:MAG TPA: hypothetical protein VHX39_24075, partial [Acetobacteraceae bacterium]|nr:hypothetical protein [Acetobacteraceae bacterium]
MILNTTATMKHWRERIGSYLFAGGHFLDPRRDELIDGIEVLVEDNLIKEVSDRPISADGAQRIDAHIHLVLTEVDLQMLVDVPLTLQAAKGSVAMRAMLERGFTT